MDQSRGLDSRLKGKETTIAGPTTYRDTADRRYRELYTEIAKNTVPSAHRLNLRFGWARGYLSPPIARFLAYLVNRAVKGMPLLKA